jgi:hypothetical protein
MKAIMKLQLRQRRKAENERRLTIIDQREGEIPIKGWEGIKVRNPVIAREQTGAEPCIAIVATAVGNQRRVRSNQKLAAEQLAVGSALNAAVPEGLALRSVNFQSMRLKIAFETHA